MTDDELERALFALPLEEPPVDLHACILAATIGRLRLTCAAWEIWTGGTLVAFMVWLTFLAATSVTDFGAAIAGLMSYTVHRLAAAIDPAALMWTGLGISFVIWVSALSLPSSRRVIANR